jgi:hypothetical protein
MLKKLTLIGSSLFMLGAHAQSAPENNDKKDKYDEWCDNLDVDKEHLEKVKLFLEKKIDEKDLDLKDEELKKVLKQIKCLTFLDAMYAMPKQRRGDINSSLLIESHEKTIVEALESGIKKCRLCVKKKLKEKKSQIKK